MGIIYDVSTPIENSKTQKTFWLKIGTAWLKEGKGLSVNLDALPTNKTLFIAQRKEKKEETPPSEPKDGELAPEEQIVP